jgi:hypothetical protein
MGPIENQKNNPKTTEESISLGLPRENRPAQNCAGRSLN